jgi:hypothetical protein
MNAELLAQWINNAANLASPRNSLLLFRITFDISAAEQAKRKPVIV